MQVAYVSGRLAHPWWLGRVWHILVAARASWGLWRRGYAVICPHTNSGIASLLPWQVEKLAHWLEGDCAFIDRLHSDDLVYMLRGWELSPGACMEHQRALDCPGVRIVYADGRAEYRVPTVPYDPRTGFLAQHLAAAGADTVPAEVLDAMDEALLSATRASGRMDPLVGGVVRQTLVAAGTFCRVLRGMDVERDTRPAAVVLTEVSGD